MGRLVPDRGAAPLLGLSSAGAGEATRSWWVIPGRPAPQEAREEGAVCSLGLWVPGASL